LFRFGNLLILGFGDVEVLFGMGIQHFLFFFCHQACKLGWEEELAVTK
jgi:hypothetical protein